MRSAATLKNSIWGIIQQAIVCVLSMFSRKVMIDTIGVEGVGLNAFLTSVITMLSIAELGIGTSIVYHMYAPLASGDNAKISQLMASLSEYLPRYCHGHNGAGAVPASVHGQACKRCKLFKKICLPYFHSISHSISFVLSFHL